MHVDMVMPIEESVAVRAVVCACLPDRSAGVGMRRGVVDKRLRPRLPGSHGRRGARDVLGDADAAGGGLFAENGQFVLGHAGQGDGLELEVKRSRL